MTPISHTVRRSIVTNIAGSVDATLAGNGSTPIVGADIVGGLTTKTVNFAANETAKTVSWDVVDDASFEGTEGYKITLSNPQPSGTLSVPSITGTVGDNDTAPSTGGGDGIVYGPQTTVDSGYVSTGGPNMKMAGKLMNADPVRLWVACNAAGTEGLLWEYIGFSSWRLYSVTGGNTTVITPGGLGSVDNVDFEMTRISGRVKLVVAGATVFDIEETSKTGTYARFNVGGGAASVTITHLA